ncbi:L,D-transpeptidase family protein [Amaricoccus sp.]|uniref:L,D-transpeptidase family protein n=1 Tax=Amaricoccus sp. TaxID=1872485 RepID=UPI001B74C20A|nr:L,D-transpeptidase family protein [Amaricoccus sp.]MBP7000442.1 L,D-transpeptidase family protein [Amaricoccus sp.]
MTIRDLRRVSAFVLAGALAALPARAEDLLLPAAAPAAPAGAAAETGLPTVDASAPAAPASPFRAGLERATAGMAEPERAAILGFYAARGDAPFWAEPGAGRMAALTAALASAETHGLPPARYQVATPADPAGAEVAAMRAWLAFGRDLSSGALTPSKVDPEIETKPMRPAPGALLAPLAGGDVAAAAAGLAPQGADYAALLAEKARLEAQRGEDWGPEAPEGKTLRLGDSGARVAALRARLAARGHAAPTPADPAAFDEGLKAALAAFQAEEGLEPDGLAGKRTIAALNAGPEDALKAVLVNLERARWTNGAFEDRYLHVNIPDYTARLVEGGRTAFATKVVVGKADDTRTPEFGATMTYLVVNPTWHVPDSIAQRVYLPKLQANPQTLANSNMRIFTRSGTEIDPGLVDFTQFQKGNFPFRIKQNPSDANALGKVKFMFPNQHSIYLHDTPHRELFAKAERAYSNGCVRVQNPEALAAILLEGQVDDPAAAFDGWVAAKAERTVTLTRPIAVHLDYRTVFLDDAGALQRRFDVYGRDAEVWRALEAAGVTLPAAEG